MTDEAHRLGLSTDGNRFDNMMPCLLVTSCELCRPWNALRCVTWLELYCSADNQKRVNLYDDRMVNGMYREWSEDVGVKV